MKLYCVKILNNNKIVDIQHMLGNNDKDIHKRMDNFLKECKIFKLQDEYNGYNFYEVSKVDEINIGQIFSHYEI